MSFVLSGPPLPTGWLVEWDPASKRPYFLNTNEGPHATAVWQDPRYVYYSPEPLSPCSTEFGETGRGSSLRNYAQGIPSQREVAQSSCSNPLSYAHSNDGQGFSPSVSLPLQQNPYRQPNYHTASYLIDQVPQSQQTQQATSYPTYTPSLSLSSSAPYPYTSTTSPPGFCRASSSPYPLSYQVQSRPHTQEVTQMSVPADMGNGYMKFGDGQRPNYSHAVLSDQMEGVDTGERQYNKGFYAVNHQVGW